MRELDANLEGHLETLSVELAPRFRFIGFDGSIRIGREQVALQPNPAKFAQLIMYFAYLDGGEPEVDKVAQFIGDVGVNIVLGKNCCGGQYIPSCWNANRQEAQIKLAYPTRYRPERSEEMFGALNHEIYHLLQEGRTYPTSQYKRRMILETAIRGAGITSLGGTLAIGSYNLAYNMLYSMSQEQLVASLGAAGVSAIGFICGAITSKEAVLPLLDPLEIEASWKTTFVFRRFTKGPYFSQHLRGQLFSCQQVDKDGPPVERYLQAPPLVS